MNLNIIKKYSKYFIILVTIILILLVIDQIIKHNKNRNVLSKEEIIEIFEQNISEFNYFQKYATKLEKDLVVYINKENELVFEDSQLSHQVDNETKKRLLSFFKKTGFEMIMENYTGDIHFLVDEGLDEIAHTGIGYNKDGIISYKVHYTRISNNWYYFYEESMIGI